MQDLVVPESQNTETSVLQIPVPHYILFRVLMLPTIHLYNHAFFETNKVKHVVHERMLAAELAPRHLPTPQMLPEKTFGVGHAVAQVSLQRTTHN